MSELKDLREMKGVSLREAGRATGMCFEYIRLFERAEKFPSKRQLRALEKYYGTDLKEYFKEVKARMLLKKSSVLYSEAMRVYGTEAKELWK
jgi:transcriptional regulator with XRE-family HTH domain